DPVSVFGGILAINRVVDEATAKEINKIFIEIVIAEGFTKEALEVLETKKNIRLLELPDIRARREKTAYDMKKVYGGLLIQDYDETLFAEENVKVVTKRAPTAEEMKALLFNWKVVKYTKSNAIVIGKEDRTTGIGMGQTNRIWAAQQAIEHAGDEAKGSVMASDAFFPFPDCVAECVKAGITAIIQPGGSKNDQLSIDACDEAGIAMIFVGDRHFRH
ncbi:MAG: bifunctional phosphoribosylaminoimidazolecarboxamide formyltransferase/IMP cyclohydrolase, partial [Clostridia bacterium]|nr:bifunctional phosphoribosylaminoimidazolecarboxamide formyltransferase/IMP cyclohydrolase [Clostridia bacterium]